MIPPWCNPLHTRAIGGTFEFTFILPRPADSGRGRPKARKANKPNRKTRAADAMQKTIPKATKPRPTEEQKQQLTC